MDWDWLITGGILLTLGLAIWAKVSRQTIPELLGNIKDALSDKGEESLEYAEEAIIYE